MPLLKRKPYPLASTAKDLKPEELVYQVRFTGEVFRSYEEYIAKINLYRQRVWTCKATGKEPLTYEEALVSELKFTQKKLPFPSEYVSPVLHIVQFCSHSRLDDLVDFIYKRFKDRYVEGEEVGAGRDGDVYRCKILKVMAAAEGLQEAAPNGKCPASEGQMDTVLGVKREGAEFLSESGVKDVLANGGEETKSSSTAKLGDAEEETEIESKAGKDAGRKKGVSHIGALVGFQKDGSALLYEVGWMSAEKEEVVEITLEDPGNLMRKKYPLTKALLKSLIKESAETANRKGFPWKVNEELAESYGIPLELPEAIREAMANVGTKEKVRKEKAEGREATWVSRKKAKQDKEGMDHNQRELRKRVKPEVKPEGEDGDEARAEEDANGGMEQGDEDQQAATAMEVDEEDKCSRKKRKKKKLADDMVDADAPRKKKPKVSKQPEKGPRRYSDPTPKVVKIVPEPIKYPIEDTLVVPDPEDPLLTERPVPSKDFLLPEECTGNLLSVWDFCCTYARTLHLSPFLLEDLERAVEYEDGEVPLLAEMHTALVRATFWNPALAEEFRRQGRKPAEVSVKSWADDVCTWIDAARLKTFYPHNFIIRKRYWQLAPAVKLDILQSLVDAAVGTEAIRGHIDQSEEALQTLIAQRKEEEVEERRSKENGEAMLPFVDLGLTEEDKEWEDFDGLIDELFRVEGSNEGRGEGDGEGAGHEVLKGWVKKRKRSSSHLSPHRLEEGSPVANGTSHGEHEVSRTQSRLAMLRQVAEQRAQEARERAQQHAEEQRVTAERRRQQQESLLERKRAEMERLQQQKKVEHFERECDKCAVRTSPLGRDRDLNRYWFFPREGRVFVEDKDMRSWGYYRAVEEVNALYGSLNPKGIRERELQKQLDKAFPRISAALQRRAKELAQKFAVEEAAVRRSTRFRSAPRAAPFMTYVNKLAL